MNRSVVQMQANNAVGSSHTCKAMRMGITRLIEEDVHYTPRGWVRSAHFIALPTSTGLPKLPSGKCNFPVTLIDAKEVDWDASDDEGHDDQRLQWLGDNCATQKKEAHAAEDDWC